MLQFFLKLVLRAAERKPVHAGDKQRSLRMDEARPMPGRPTGGFLAQVLRSAIAQKHAESGGGRALHRPPCEPSSNPATQGAEQPDEKIIRLTPRRRPATEQVPSLPTHDDNDPGPSAA
jgi:hypothetical protein